MKFMQEYRGEHDWRCRRGGGMSVSERIQVALKVTVLMCSILLIDYSLCGFVCLLVEFSDGE